MKESHGMVPAMAERNKPGGYTDCRDSDGGGKTIPPETHAQTIAGLPKANTKTKKAAPEGAA